MKIQNVKFLTCTVSGGVFEKGKIYPFCLLDGYAYIVVIDAIAHAAKLFHLDCYTDGTYKIAGTWDSWEDAEFMEAI